MVTLSLRIVPVRNVSFVSHYFNAELEVYADCVDPSISKVNYCSPFALKEFLKGFLNF
jgi:hypothetical protein